jgi:hypothetical protein
LPDFGVVGVASVVILGRATCVEVAVLVVSHGRSLSLFSRNKTAPRCSGEAIAYAVSYPGAVTDHWGTFGLLDDLPASEVIRTGEAMYFRTAEEYLSRFPVFNSTPVVGSDAMALTPIGSVGALVTGYGMARAFSAADRDALTVLAAVAARRWAALPAE